MGGGEGVPRHHGVRHQPLPVPAPAHSLLLVDLGLPAPHRGGRRRLDGVLAILGVGFLVLGLDAAAALSGGESVVRTGGRWRWMHGGCRTD